MRRFLLSTAIAALPLAVSAHEVAKGPNGGPVVESSGHHVEMVIEGTQLVLFLTDEADKPLASGGSKNARAIVQEGDRTATVPLAPAEPNKLVGMLAQPLGPGARVVVSATMADGHAVQARFAAGRAAGGLAPAQQTRAMPGMDPAAMQQTMQDSMPNSTDSASTKDFKEANMSMMMNMHVGHTGNPDVDFRAHMIPHHQGAIDMAKAALKHVTDPVTKKMAESIIKDQEREIGEMKDWLKEHGK